jgi:hypothetical protein
MDLLPTQDWRFPFKLPKRGPVISQPIVSRCALENHLMQGRAVCWRQTRAPSRACLFRVRRGWTHRQAQEKLRWDLLPTFCLEFFIWVRLAGH